MSNRLIAILVILCLPAFPGYAQTILKVPLSSAKLAWDAGVPGPGESVATKHVVTCGTVSKDVLMPTTSLAVKDIVPGPGTYNCTIYAVNDFDRQLDPDGSFPSFQAGNPPSKGSNFRLEVK